MPDTVKLLLLPLVITMMLLSACQEEQGITTQEEKLASPRPAKIVGLTQNNIKLQRSYPGTLEAAQKADLAFRVSGQLVELLAKPGLRVKKGDLLAKLDPKDFKNTLAERQARFNLANSQLKKVRTLRNKKLVSETNFDQANAELGVARAALQQAKDNLRYTALYAPFDGVVARVDIENYQPVQAQTPVILLRDIEQLSIRFSVPESVLAQFKQVEDPRMISSFCGLVRLVTHVNQPIRACYKAHETIPDSLTRNYGALFELDPIGDFVVLPGMSASIELDFSLFLADQIDRSVYAPIEAVFSENGQQWLWLVDEQMIARRYPVEVGRIEGDKIAITSAIDPNSQIIAAGVSFVREGMRVKPMIKQRGL